MARTFSGTGQYLTLATPILKDYPITLSAWFRLNNVTGAKGVLGIGGQNVNTRNEISLYISGTAFWALAQIDTFEAAVSTATLSASTWYHGCGVFPSMTERTAYINGGNAVTNTNDIIIDPVYMLKTKIGQRANDLDDQPFAGWIAECTIWGAALTAAEVYLLSKGIPSYLIRPSKIQAYVPLLSDEDTNVIQPRTIPRLSVSKFVKTGAPGVAPHPPGIIQKKTFANSSTFDPATNWPEIQKPPNIDHIPSTSPVITATGAVVRSPMWGTY